MAQKWMLAAVGLSLLTMFNGDSAAQRAFFRLDELRPGMKGTGKTCYQGSKPEEFQVEILGIMRGVGPGADAVLARFSGGPLEKTGIFEGMSGSPVFIDGRLLGAVAFSFAFPKEAIGGITPITQMVEAFEESGPGTPVTPRVLLKKSLLWDYRLPPDGSGGIAGLFPSALTERFPPALEPSGGHSLRPIATPVSMGGFSARTLQLFAPQFRAMGFSIIQGSGSSAIQLPARGRTRPEPDEAPLEPGSNLVVPLIRGDLDFSAGGTVTWIDGKKVYAFGHPLFNLGFSELPMHKGRVITVFPGLQSSFKITEATEPVGAVRQDRAAGIYGILGENARMIPMNVRMTTSRGVRKSLAYELARDAFLTPFLVNLTLFNSIIASERALGMSTLEVKGVIRIRGEQPVEIENRFSTDSNSPAYASLSIAIPVNFLLASGFKDVHVENIDVEIRALEDGRAAFLDALRIDKAELRAGETVILDVFLKKNDGEVIQESYPLRIPPDITPGGLSAVVADGTTIMAMEAREQGEEIIPRDLGQLIRFINNIRRNDRLYVRLFRNEPGAVVKGEGLPSLPPSILSILRSDRNTGSMSPIPTTTLLESELAPNDYVVSGSKSFNIVIKP